MLGYVFPTVKSVSPFFLFFCFWKPLWPTWPQPTFTTHTQNEWEDWSFHHKAHICINDVKGARSSTVQITKCYPMKSSVQVFPEEKYWDLQTRCYKRCRVNSKSPRWYTRWLSISLYAFYVHFCFEKFKINDCILHKKWKVGISVKGKCDLMQWEQMKWLKGDVSRSCDSNITELTRFHYRRKTMAADTDERLFVVSNVDCAVFVAFAFIFLYVKLVASSNCTFYFLCGKETLSSPVYFNESSIRMTLEDGNVHISAFCFLSFGKLISHFQFILMEIQLFSLSSKP